MKRIGRHIFNGLAVLSLLLGVAAAALWVQGHFGQVGYGVRSKSGLRTFQTVRGGFQHVHIFMDDATSLNDLSDTGWHSGPAHDTVLPMPQFGLGTASLTLGHWHVKAILVPAYLLVAIFSMLPAIWMRLRVGESRRRKWIQTMRCPSCGYDLRATPDRCPECGTAIPTKVTS